MSYKLIAIDMDDTLLNEELEISEENLEAISHAHRKGIKVILCTGRPTDSVVKYLNRYPILRQQDYFIAFNGAVIISVINNNIMFKKEIPKHILDKLIDIGYKENVDIQLYSDKDLYVSRYTERTKSYEKLSGIKSTLITDLKDIESSIKVLYNCWDVIKLENIKTEIETTFKEDLNVFFSKKCYLEVLEKNANKGLALEYISNQLNINPEEVIAIGDSENDLYMINYAGLGVCMKNGRETIKQKAQYITKNDFNNSGVAEVIYKFIK